MQTWRSLAPLPITFLVILHFRCVYYFLLHFRCVNYFTTDKYFTYLYNKLYKVVGLVGYAEQLFLTTATAYEQTCIIRNIRKTWRYCVMCTCSYKKKEKERERE